MVKTSLQSVSELILLGGEGRGRQGEEEGDRKKEGDRKRGRGREEGEGREGEGGREGGKEREARWGGENDKILLI